MSKLTIEGPLFKKAAMKAAKFFRDEGDGESALAMELLACHAAWPELPYWEESLKALPKMSLIRNLEGKHLFLRSIFPPLVQMIVDGIPKSVLRISPEPLVGSDIYPESGIRKRKSGSSARMDFFSRGRGETTENGLYLTSAYTNLLVGSSIERNEVFDWVGLSIVYPASMSTADVEAFKKGASFYWHYSSSQPLIDLPLACMPSSRDDQVCGVSELPADCELTISDMVPGVQAFLDLRTKDGFPRRIWDLECFGASIVWDGDGPDFDQPPIIRVIMHGRRYVR